MYCPNCGTFNEDTAVSCGICCKPTGALPCVGFWRRFGALFIDGIILGIVSRIVLLVISPVIMYFFYDSFYLLFASFSLLHLVIGITYFAGLESSSYQATFGKQFLSVKVTDLEGNRISFGKATARYFLKTITGAIFGIGYLAIIFSKKKQGLYDMAVGTAVIRE
ncbi:RDD family protein [Methanolobus sp. ZRKC2]|uniref:RDD family protein n=1 Tax=Methanolobus sp. ZRKC2 TaxID=3125783 RepID=UPI003249868C